MFFQSAKETQIGRLWKFRFSYIFVIISNNIQVYYHKKEMYESTSNKFLGNRIIYR